MDAEGKWIESLTSDPKRKEIFEKNAGKSTQEMIAMRNATLRSCPSP